MSAPACACSTWERAPGYAAAAAAERGAVATGVDIADELLALARRRHPEIRFLRGRRRGAPLRGAARSTPSCATSRSTTCRGPSARSGSSRASWRAAEDCALGLGPARAQPLLGILVDAVGPAASPARRTRPRVPTPIASPTTMSSRALLRGAGLEDVEVRYRLAHPSGCRHRGALAGDARRQRAHRRARHAAAAAHAQEDPRGGGAARRRVPCGRRTRHSRMREDRRGRRP